MKIIPESETQFEDPKTKTRLTTIQGVGLSIEAKIEIAKIELHRAQGVVAGLTAAAVSEIPATMAEVGKLVEDGKLDEDRGKDVLAWLQKARERVESAVRINARNIAKQEGVIEGLTKSVDECETLFRQEVAKARQRENESDRGRRDEGGRPISLREQRGEAPIAEPVAKQTKRPRKRAN